MNLHARNILDTYSPKYYDGMLWTKVYESNNTGFLVPIIDWTANDVLSF